MAKQQPNRPWAYKTTQCPRERRQAKRMAVIAIGAALLTANCASTPPSQIENICEIFREKDGFFEGIGNSACVLARGPSMGIA